MRERYSRISQSWSGLDTKISVILAVNGLLLTLGGQIFGEFNLLRLISGLLLGYSMMISLMVLFLPYKITRPIESPEKFESNLGENQKDYLLMKFHGSSLKHNEEMRDKKLRGAIEAAEFSFLNILLIATWFAFSLF